MHGKEQSGGGRDDEMLSSVVVVVVGRGWTSLAQGCSRLARSPFGPQLAGCPRGFGNAPTLQWRELPAEPCALVSRAAGGGPVAVLHNPGGLLPGSGTGPPAGAGELPGGVAPTGARPQGKNDDQMTRLRACAAMSSRVAAAPAARPAAPARLAGRGPIPINLPHVRRCISTALSSSMSASTCANLAAAPYPARPRGQGPSAPRAS